MNNPSVASTWQRNGHVNSNAIRQQQEGNNGARPQRRGSVSPAPVQVPAQQLHASGAPSTSTSASSSRAAGVTPPLSGLGFSTSAASYAQEPSYFNARNGPIGPPPKQRLPDLPMADSTRGDQVASQPSHSQYAVRPQKSKYRGSGSPFAYPSPEPTWSPEPSPSPSEVQYVSTRPSQTPRRTMGSSPPFLRNTSSSMYGSAQGHSHVSNSYHDSGVGTYIAPIRRPSEGAKSSTASVASTIHPTATIERRQTQNQTAQTSQMLQAGSSSQRHPSTATPSTNSSSSRTTDHVPSKAVLTTALRQAQIAVSLDGEGNEEAAIEAYRTSVHLLKEVMERVAESSAQRRQNELAKLEAARNRRRRLARAEKNAAANTPNGPASDHSDSASSPPADVEETEEERRENLHMLAKIEKREQARLDEKAKLQTIHDTYQARILILMEELAERRQVEMASASARKDAQIHLSSRSRASSSASSSRSTSGNRAVSPVRPSLDSGRAKIGSALLSSSPVSQTFSSPPQSPPISSIPLNHRHAQSADFARSSKTHSPAPSIPLPELHPLNLGPTTFGDIPEFAKISGSKSKGAPKDAEKSMLSFSPDPDSAHVEVFEGQMGSTFKDKSAASGNSMAASHQKAPSDFTAENFTSGRAKSVDPRPHSRTDVNTANATVAGTSDLARTRQLLDSATDMDREELEDLPSDLTATPTPDTMNSVAFKSTPSSDYALERGQSATDSSLWSSAKPDATSQEAQALQRMNSSESLSSNASGVLSNGPWSTSMLQTAPVPPQSAAGQPESPSLPTESSSIQPSSGITRSTRSASLVAAAHPMHTRNPDSMRTGDSTNNSRPLVNPTINEGAVMQRRSSPTTAKEAVREGAGQSYNSIPPPPSRSQNTDNVPLDTSSAGEDRDAFTSRQLPFEAPARIRSVSQPSTRRPSLPSPGSERPPLPPLAYLDNAGYRKGSLSPQCIVSAPSPVPDALSPTAGDSATEREQTRSPMLVNDSSDSSTNFLEPDTPIATNFLSSAHQQASLSQPIQPGQNGFSPPSASPMRRPFHFMHQLRITIQNGGYLTPRLYIPKQMWTQSGIKIMHTETKVRMLDLLLAGLEAIERSGEPILATNVPINVGIRNDAASKLIRELESFEGMLDGVQSTLSKKVGSIEATGSKRGNPNALSAWGSKLSKTMDKMTKGKNLDAPETYVAAIARLCLHVQVLDRHLEILHSKPIHAQPGLNTPDISKQEPSAHHMPPGYNEISYESRRTIEGKLRRASEFFGKVICQMILQDLNIWLDKYSKRAANWTID